MKCLPSTNHGCRNNQSDNASRLLPFPRPPKAKRAPNESSSKLRSLHRGVVSRARQEPRRDLAFHHRRLNIASKRWASTRRNLSFAERPTNPPNSPDSPDLPNSPQGTQLDLQYFQRHFNGALRAFRSVDRAEGDASRCHAESIDFRLNRG